MVKSGINHFLFPIYPTVTVLDPVHSGDAFVCLLVALLNLSINCYDSTEGEVSLNGWSAVVQVWTQLLHYIQIFTHFLFLVNPNLLNWKPAEQWSLPIRWLFPALCFKLTSLSLSRDVGQQKTIHRLPGLYFETNIQQLRYTKFCCVLVVLFCWRHWCCPNRCCCCCWWRCCWPSQCCCCCWWIFDWMRTQ